MRRLAPALIALSLAIGPACSPAPLGPVDPVATARDAAEGSTDPDILGRWLLTEMLAPGGSVEQAGKAREALAAATKGKDATTMGSLARAVDADVHGDLHAALEAYVACLGAAKVEDAPTTELVAWYASSRALALSRSISDSWEKYGAAVEAMITDPGRLGWRARTNLVDWWYRGSRVGSGAAATSVADLDAEARRRFGCIDTARFAGPFGRPSPSDIITNFPAEGPGAWPTAFPQHPDRPTPPRTSAAERGSSFCSLRASSTSGDGVYYVEAFVELDESMDVILAVQGAWAVLVDDFTVVSHSPKHFGTWARNSAEVHLTAGRHRIVARLRTPETYIRVLDRAGRPADVRVVNSSSSPYELSKPRFVGDPNPLARAAAEAGVLTQGGPFMGTALDEHPIDPVTRFLTASLAHDEGLDDLAAVLMSPLVKEPSKAAPLALSSAGQFAESDPVYSEKNAADLALQYHDKAATADPQLWYSRVWLVIDAASKRREVEQLAPLAELAKTFPEVPMIGKSLAALYARVGYRVEQRATIRDLAARYPNDPDILRWLLAVHDEAGERSEADAVAARIALLEADSTIEVERAISRNDLPRAVELIRARASTAEGEVRKSLLRRAEELLVRAGKDRETLERLERALEAHTTRAVLEYADAKLAGGDHAALRRALAESLRAGIETGELRDAIEVVDGVTELEPFRIDGAAVIREYESSGAAQSDPSGKRRAGTATRVLDYATLWVHEDGSARMLEHEILHMASAEAIQDHAEQPIPNGKLLRVRTVKPDGTTYEPEFVAGKPTLTMPHLEKGDYIERETLYELPSDGRNGKSFLGPRWFFREAKVDYRRSEFIVVAPTDRALEIETTGSVPKPEVTRGPSGASSPLTIYRWRVDESPALPNEPFGAAIEEFLPSVRVGWGVSERQVLDRALDATADLVPDDPRLVLKARDIASGFAPPDEQAARLAATTPLERARRIYRWVLDNVRPEHESDPRRSVLGESGSALTAFMYLAHLVGVDARYALIQNATKAPPKSTFAEAERFTDLAVSIALPGDTRVWTQIEDKYAPFGYIPTALRNQSAVLLTPDLPHVTTAAGGPPDGITNEGVMKIASDGSARLKLDQKYEGRLAILLRSQIEQVSDPDVLKQAIESEILAKSLPGARLASVEVVGLDHLDDPLILRMDVEVSSFGRRTGKRLVIPPPFSSSLRLGVFATLEHRETPILFPAESSVRLSVSVKIEVPPDAKIQSVAAPVKGQHQNRSFSVSDSVSGSTIDVERVVDMPAGRVETSDYPAFVEFTRTGDEAFRRDFIVELP
ncbi:MAG: hypothetical protein U0271_34565 [Polyangiaceae bacterium]